MFKACLDNFINFYFKIKCWGIFLKGLKYGLVVEHLFNVYKILVLILNIIKKINQLFGLSLIKYGKK